MESDPSECYFWIMLAYCFYNVTWWLWSIMRFRLRSCFLLTAFSFLTFFYFQIVSIGRSAIDLHQRENHEDLDAIHSHKKKQVNSGRPWSFRIIVLTFNRSHSLSACLEKLQDLHLDGTSTVLEIRIDRFKSGKVW